MSQITYKKDLNKGKFLKKTAATTSICAVKIESHFLTCASCFGRLSTSKREIIK